MAEMDNLNVAVSVPEGASSPFHLAPSIAQFIAARVIRGLRQRFPDLDIDLDILKIEETLDYLLLEKGEVVIMSSTPARAPIGEGPDQAIMPEGHVLAQKLAVSIHDLVQYPFIGVDPSDPYGKTLARPFDDAGLTPRHAMRGRFAQTIVSLVRHGLGVAVIDERYEVHGRLVRRPLVDSRRSPPGRCSKLGRQLSSFAEQTVTLFRRELGRARARERWDQPAD